MKVEAKTGEIMEEKYLSEQEELKCNELINFLRECNNKIDYFLWYLKYKLLENENKKSRRYGSFTEICNLLYKEYDFPLALNTCHEKAWAYEERRILIEEIKIERPRIKKLSVMTLLELRKEANFVLKKEILETALLDCSQKNKVTRKDIINARNQVYQKSNKSENVLFIKENTEKNNGVESTYKNPQKSELFNQNNKQILDQPKLQQYGGLQDDFLINEETMFDSRAFCFDKTINNQGIQYQQNWKIFQWKGMRFRSKAEIEIAKALDCLGVAFWPNNLGRITDPKRLGGRANVEVDFLVIHNGKTGILEVDGPHHTPKTRFEEQLRERLFRRNGIRIIERYDATKCYEQPKEVVREFLELFDKMYSSIPI